MTKAKSISVYGERERYLHCITQISILTSNWYFFQVKNIKLNFDYFLNQSKCRSQVLYWERVSKH